MRAHLERWLPQGSFARHVSVLTGGTVFAQGLAFLALPILTRLYTPQDFSLLAIYTAALGIVTTIASGRYNLAITMPADDDDAIAVLVVALLCVLGTAVFLSLLILLVPDLLTRWVELEAAQKLDASLYLWLLPLGILAYGSYDAIQYWTSRKRRFNVITRTRMTRAIGGVGTQLTWGILSPGPLGLLVGNVVYGALGIIALSRNFLSQDGGLLQSLSWKKCKQQARVFQRFPKLSVPEALFNVMGAQLPIILIGTLHPGPEAGQLMLAMTVIGAPMALIGSSVSQVYISEAPSRFRSGTLTVFTRQTMWTLFKYSAPLLLVIGLASPIAFPLIFGEEWARAGWLVLWMTPWFIFQFVASPLSTVLYITNRMGYAVALQLFGVIIRVGAVSFAAFSMADQSSKIYALSGALFYGLYCLIVFDATSERRHQE